MDLRDVRAEARLALPAWDAHNDVRRDREHLLQRFQKIRVRNMFEDPAAEDTVETVCRDLPVDLADVALIIRLERLVEIESPYLDLMRGVHADERGNGAVSRADNVQFLGSGASTSPIRCR